MNRIRIRRPRARSEHPWPRALSADPPGPEHRPGQGRSRGPRVPGRRPGHDGLGRQAPMAGCPDGYPRGQDGPPRAGVRVGMHPAHQRGGAANRSRSVALGSFAGRFPARRQPPAGPGPERNGALTRAGGRGPRSRPRHLPVDPPGLSPVTGPSPAAARPPLDHPVGASRARRPPSRYARRRVLRGVLLAGRVRGGGGPAAAGPAGPWLARRGARGCGWACIPGRRPGRPPAWWAWTFIAPPGWRRPGTGGRSWCRRHRRR